MSRVAPDVVDLLPQTGRARFVEAVLERYDDGIKCAGRIPLEHPLVRGGSVASFIGLELAAQAAAVFEALRRCERGGEDAPRIGLLVSLRDVRLELTELPAGMLLVASVRAKGGAAALSLYEARVFDGGTLAVQGTLGTYLPSFGAKVQGLR